MIIYHAEAFVQRKEIYIYILLSLFERKTRKDRCHVFCERFKTCFLNENHPEQFAFVAWSFLGSKIHWLEPEDQLDTTVPSTLLSPAAITLPICPLCPCAQIFWGRMGIAKAIKVSLHHWEDRRLRLQQGLRFPVSKLLRVSGAVFAFYKTLGFRFTMEVFSTRGGLGPSGAPMFLRNIVVTQVTPSTRTTLCQTGPCFASNVVHQGWGFRFTIQE